MSERDDFAAMLDASLSTGGGGKKKIRPGQVVDGIVVQVGRDTVFLDVGTRSEGALDRWQVEDENGDIKVAVGDRIRVTVTGGGDRPKLAIRIAKGSGVDVQALEAAMEAGAPVDGEVTKTVKAGLEVQIGNIRAFCPVSQIDLHYTEDPSVYEGQTLRFKVIEVREGGRSVVVSRKALMQAERQEMAGEIIAKLEVGAVMEGRVTSCKNYGAFVDLGGIEGLIHISELAHARVASVEDVVQPGETVSVKILEIDRREDPPKLRLSMRALVQAPPRGETRSQKVIAAKVTKVEPFGVIVEIEGGSGVVPTRELELPPGGDPRRAYPVGAEIRVVGIGKDQHGRPRFSVTKVEEAEARANFQEFTKASEKAQRNAGGVGSFGELLKSRLAK